MIRTIFRTVAMIAISMGGWELATAVLPSLSPSTWHLTRTNIVELAVVAGIYCLIQPFMVAWWGNQIANVPKGYNRTIKGVVSYRRAFYNESRAKSSVVIGVSLPALVFVSAIMGFLQICGLRLVTRED